MARRTISIDEKIERSKLKVSKAKDSYDEALSELKNLMEEKKKIQSKELIVNVNTKMHTFYQINMYKIYDVCVPSSAAA